MVLVNLNKISLQVYKTVISWIDIILDFINLGVYFVKVINC